MLVVNGRRGAGEVVDLVDLDIERKGHVVADELEARMIVQVFDVAFAAGEQVVGAQYLVALFKKPVAQMRSQKSGAAGDEYSFTAVVCAHRIRFLQVSNSLSPILRKNKYSQSAFASRCFFSSDSA